MAINDEDFSDTEVDRLVRQAVAYVGELIKGAAHNSFSVKGARHLAQYAQEELKEIKERVYGREGRAPDPAIRQHTLRKLQHRFPNQQPPATT